MHEAEVAGLLHAAMLVCIKLAGPPLAVALIVGIVMSLIQAITQINEQTLTFLPKVVAKKDEKKVEELVRREHDSPQRSGRRKATHRALRAAEGDAALTQGGGVGQCVLRLE